MSIEEVVEYINSHDDPVLSEEMNSLVMAACYQTHRLTMQLNNTYHEPDEIREMSGWGAEPVTLGKRILRTETAGLAALSVFFGLYGEME